MWHSLAGGGTIVDANVIARGVEQVVEIVTGRSQKRHQVGALCVRDFEERRHMPLRDDQRVAGRDREAVADDDCEFALMNDAFGGQGAEGAGRTQCNSRVDQPSESSPGRGGIPGVSANSSLRNARLRRQGNWPIRQAAMAKESATYSSELGLQT